MEVLDITTQTKSSSATADDDLLDDFSEETVNVDEYASSRDPAGQKSALELRREIERRNERRRVREELGLYYLDL